MEEWCCVGIFLYLLTEISCASFFSFVGLGSGAGSRVFHFCKKLVGCFAQYRLCIGLVLVTVVSFVICVSDRIFSGVMVLVDSSVSTSALRWFSCLLSVF